MNCLRGQKQISIIKYCLLLNKTLLNPHREIYYKRITRIAHRERNISSFCLNMLTAAINRFGTDHSNICNTSPQDPDKKHKHHCACPNKGSGHSECSLRYFQRVHYFRVAEVGS